MLELFLENADANLAPRSAKTNNKKPSAQLTASILNESSQALTRSFLRLISTQRTSAFSAAVAKTGPTFLLASFKSVSVLAPTLISVASTSRWMIGSALSMLLCKGLPERRY